MGEEGSPAAECSRRRKAWEEAGQSAADSAQPALLGLAVRAQLGTSYWQLGSHATFHKGMNGQVGAGKRET